MPARAPGRAALLLAATTLVTALLATGIAGCILPPLSSQATPVPGSGEVATEDRSAGPFRHISVGAGLKVIVGTSREPSVTLAAQPNLLKLITTQVREDQLIVEVSAPGITSTEPITLTVHVPALESITLSAGATGTIEVVGGALVIDVSGGATVKAIGEVDTLTLTASSGASASLGEFTAGSAAVTLTGGSSAEMHVTGAVTGTADGGSTLTLTRKPASVNVKTSSGGSVLGG